MPHIFFARVHLRDCCVNIQSKDHNWSHFCELRTGNCGYNYLRIAKLSVDRPDEQFRRQDQNFGDNMDVWLHPALHHRLRLLLEV